MLRSLQRTVCQVCNPTPLTSSGPSQARFCYRHHAFQVQGSPQPRYAGTVRICRTRISSCPTGRFSLPRRALATEKRKQEAQRIREKYPDRVPVRTGARHVAPASPLPLAHIPTFLSLDSHLQRTRSSARRRRRARLRRLTSKSTWYPPTSRWASSCTSSASASSSVRRRRSSSL